MPKLPYRRSTGPNGELQLKPPLPMEEATAEWQLIFDFILAVERLAQQRADEGHTSSRVLVDERHYERLVNAANHVYGHVLGRYRGVRSVDTAQGMLTIVPCPDAILYVPIDLTDDAR